MDDAGFASVEAESLSEVSSSAESALLVRGGPVIRLHGWEVVVFFVLFLLFFLVVLTCVSAWGDMVDDSVLIDDNWLPLEVFVLSVVCVFFWINMVLGWAHVVAIGAVVSVSVSLKAIDSGELVPKDSIGDSFSLS